jgi:hypothetical protein
MKRSADATFFRLAACSLSLLVFSGCSSGLPPESRPDDARVHLTRALDAWKAGEAAATLADSKPPLRVIDRDWQERAQLESYKLAEEGQQLGLNIQWTVDLSLRLPNGKERSKRVTYVVASGSNPVVARQDADF